MGFDQRSMDGNGFDNRSQNRFGDFDGQSRENFMSRQKQLEEENFNRTRFGGRFDQESEHRSRGFGMGMSEDPDDMQYDDGNPMFKNRNNAFNNQRNQSRRDSGDREDRNDKNEGRGSESA